MKHEIPASERLLAASEFAALVSVSPITVTRWANLGRLSYLRTPGGRRRYREADALAIAAGTYVMPGGAR